MLKKKKTKTNCDTSLTTEYYLTGKNMSYQITKRYEKGQFEKAICYVIPIIII